MKVVSEIAEPRRPQAPLCVAIRAAMGLWAVLPVCASGSAVAAETVQLPVASRSGDVCRVVHPEFVAEVWPSGRLRLSTTAPESRVLVDRFDVYSDRGLFAESEHWTSMLDERARLEVEPLDQGLRLVSEGRLAARGIEATQRPEVRFRFVLEFGRGPEIGVSIRLVPSTKIDAGRAFLAHTLGLPSVSEMGIRTVDGWLFEDLEDRRERVWQSLGRPLSIDEGKLLLRSGDRWITLATDRTAQACNVFVHKGSSPRATVFFAWLDGPLQHAVGPERPLSLRYQIRLGGSADLLPAGATIEAD